MNTQQNTLSNYLVPAAGGTHGVTIKGDFTSSPYLIDWRQYAIDNFPFQPQGVFADNSQGTGPLTITINPLGYSVIVPAGSIIQAQFPAPNGQTAEVTGDGNATLIFVDFPVLPNGNSTTIAGGTVDIGNTPTITLPVNNAGNPYQVQNTPVAGSVTHLSIAAGATTATVAAPAGTSLRRLSLALSGATIGAAANVTLTATLNGVTVYTTNVYVGATASNGSLSYDFDFSAAPIPSAGNFVITLGTALTTGIVDGNALFA